MPPPLSISIIPLLLKGTADPATGRVELDFDASFAFSIGSLYKAPLLRVVCSLTTEENVGELRRGKGSRLSGDGSIRLVGVARVPVVEARGMRAIGRGGTLTPLWVVRVADRILLLGLL